MLGQCGLKLLLIDQSRYSQERPPAEASQQRLLDVFVQPADTFVAEFDAVEFLHTAAERSVELLGADSVGLMFADQRGSLRVIASSSEQP